MLECRLSFLSNPQINSIHVFALLATGGNLLDIAALNTLARKVGFVNGLTPLGR
jgi:hypothetical protein